MDSRTSNQKGRPERIWRCKVGGPADFFQKGADGPMRAAVAKAFREITGLDAEFIFSGWGAELTEGERAVVENRAPKACEIDHPHHYECKHCGIGPPTPSEPPTEVVPIAVLEALEDVLLHADFRSEDEWHDFTNAVAAARKLVDEVEADLGKQEQPSETKEGNQAEASSSGDVSAAPTPRGSLPNSLGNEHLYQPDQEWMNAPLGAPGETLSKRMRDAGFTSRRPASIPPDDEPSDETGDGNANQ